MSESTQVILFRTFGAIVLVFSITVMVFAISRHNHAEAKMREYARLHQEPDSATIAILRSDSLYVFSHR